MCCRGALASVRPAPCPGRALLWVKQRFTYHFCLCLDVLHFLRPSLCPPKGKNFKKTSSETLKHAGAKIGLSNIHSELEAISATPVSVFADIFFRVLLLWNKGGWSKEGSLQENFAPCDLLIIHHLSLDLLKPALLSPDLSTISPAPASNIHFPFPLASSLGCCPV